MAFIYFVLSVFYIVVYWRIFEKSGIAGWKTLIPFYNTYLTIVRIARKPVWYFWSIVLTPILYYPFILIGNYGFVLADILVYILIIFLIVLNIKIIISVSKNFGKSGGFAVGIIFLAPIFIPILAFDKSKFIYKEENKNENKNKNKNEND